MTTAKRASGARKLGAVLAVAAVSLGLAGVQLRRLFADADDQLNGRPDNPENSPRGWADASEINERLSRLM